MVCAVEIRAGIPPHDAAEFARLPDQVKWEVLDLLDTFRGVSVDARHRASLARVASANRHKPGWSAKTLERKFCDLRRTGDWHVLVNRAKTSGGVKSAWISDAVREAWRGYCDRHPRSLKTAYIEMCADYRAGMAVGDVDWRRVWAEHPDLALQPMPPACPEGMPLPEGWSYVNMMRHKPRAIETVAARKGPHAARKLCDRVHTTREGLPPGAQYSFDDMWHNCKVLYKGYPKAVSPLELSCIDISSGHKVAFALKPRMEDAAGKRQNITEADMRFLVAHVLCNIGYHPDGCLLLLEGGTATLRKRMKLLLDELSGGKIKVSISGVDRKVLLGKWGYETKGNPDHKAHIESSHNLHQNRLDGLPGYAGSFARIDRPEDHAALMRVVDRTLAAACTLPEHLAARLRFPVLDWATFSDTVHEVYAQISHSNDHALEGWHNRTERQWRAHPADIWHSEDDLYRLPEDAQRALAPIIAREGMSRAGVRLSRAQVWERGQSGLVRLPDYAAMLICGDDMAETRECPEGAEIVFINQEADGSPMIFRLSSCAGPDGGRVQLGEGKPYKWLVNPFDTRAVFVSDMSGRYVGKCARADVVDRSDTEAIGVEAGRARRALNEALAPLARRNAGKARQMIADMANNTAVLKEANAAAARLLEDERAVSGERREAIKGVSIDDLTSGGGVPSAGENDGDEVSFNDLF